MDKEKLDRWVEKLNAEPDGKKRNALVGGMCKENGLKIDEAVEAEAGFDPKADEGGDDKPPVVTSRKLNVTHGPQYRRARIVLSRKAAACEVTA
jgi:hypothetical protein